MPVHAKIAAALTATLAQLKPGKEYPDGNIQARIHYTEAEIDELAASLMPDQDGQLRPFLVASHPKKPGQFFVFGGGRRRLAYERLIGSGKLPKDHPIEIQDHGHVSVKLALSKSLADNQAVPMHPADQAVTFALLAKDKTPGEIGAARGMTERAVCGLIALGEELVPEAISAWRADKITKAEAQELVLGNAQQQKDAVKELEQDGSFNQHHYRAAISANKEAVMTRWLGFVGVDAAAAGGVGVRQDFFGTGGVVKDLGKLEKLANAKMRSLEKAEIAAGWSWAEGKITSYRGMHHGYGEQKVKAEFTAPEKARIAEIAKAIETIQEDPFQEGAEPMRKVTALEHEKEIIEQTAQSRAFNDKQKKAGGVLIRLREDGSVIYLRGLTRKPEKPSKGKRATPAGAARREAEEPALTWNARHALKDWQNETMGELLSKHPKDVMALLLTSGSIRGSECIISTNLNDEDNAYKFSGFEAGYHLFKKMTPEKLGQAVCVMFRGCVDAVDYQGFPKKGMAFLAGIVGEKEYQSALADTFYANCKTYFGNASHKHLLGCIAEAFGAAARRDAEDKGLAALVKIMLEEVKKTGWLPPELRTKVYSGPTAKAPAKAAAKAEALDQAKKAAKPAKKKAR